MAPEAPSILAVGRDLARLAAVIPLVVIVLGMAAAAVLVFAPFARSSADHDDWSGDIVS